MDDCILRPSTEAIVFCDSVESPQNLKLSNEVQSAPFQDVTFKMNQVKNVQNDQQITKFDFEFRPTVIEDFQTPNKDENKQRPIPQQLLGQKVAH